MDFIDNILYEVTWRTKEGYPDFTIPEHRYILRKVLTEFGIPDNIIDEIITYLRDDVLVKNKVTGSEYTVKNVDPSKHIVVKKDPTKEPESSKELTKEPDDNEKKELEKHEKELDILKITPEQKQKLASVYAGKNITDIDKPASKIVYTAAKLSAIVAGEKVELSKEDIEFINNEFTLSTNPTSTRFYYMASGKIINNKLPKGLGRQATEEMKAAIIKNAENIMKAYPGLKFYFKVGTTRVPLDKKAITAAVNNRKPATFKPQNANSIGVSHIKQHAVTEILGETVTNKFKEMGYNPDNIKIYNGKIDTNKPETSVNVLNEIHKSLVKSINSPNVDSQTKEYMNKFVGEMESVLKSDIPPAEKLETLNKKLSKMATDAATSASELGEEEGRNFIKDFGETLTYIHYVSAGREVYMPAGGTFPIADLIYVEGEKDKPVKIDQISIKSAYGNASVDGAASSAPEVLRAIRSSLPPEEHGRLDEISSLHDKSIDKINFEKLSPTRRNHVMSIKSLENVSSKNEAIEKLRIAGFTDEEITRTLEKFFEKKIAVIEDEIGQKIENPYKNASTLLKEYAYRNYVAKETNAFFKEQKGKYPVIFVTISNKSGFVDVKEKGRPNISDIEVEEKGSIDWYFKDGKVISTGYKYGNMGARPKYKQLK